MKKLQKVAVVALSSLFALSMFAACKDEGSTATGEGMFARICYDNLNAAQSYVNEADTKITVSGSVKNIKATDEEGDSISDPDEVATYDAATKTFTAVSRGTIHFELDGLKSKIEVVPAYVTKPGNDYTGSGNDYFEKESKQLGNTHDPSFIEVEEDGQTVYYLFSTGWELQTKVDGIDTYGNAIHVSYDGMATWQYAGRTFDLNTRDEMLEESGIGDWLYNGVLSAGGNDTSYTKDSAGWWAPDIVKAPDGGYWLYTCVVDGAGGSSGMLIGGKRYARAACLLFYSKDLYQGTFEYKGVLMQSSIQRGETVYDVNGIDPQIIYTPDGKMYMAYGSFGSGNWMIELNPKTGLRMDGKNEWQTHETIRGYVEGDVQDFYNNNKLGQSHEYYGTYISKGAMEAPVIARHDNVIIADETKYDPTTGELKDAVTGKTYYYTMHSYYGLDQGYQMWGGRSENVTGVYKSATGKGNVVNDNFGSNANQGNKYMGAFTWSNKPATSKEINIVLPGHNDLYTAKNGTNLAAYITRTTFPASSTSKSNLKFVVQVHQYYLNSMGDIVINPNRYGKEIDRSVSKEELLAFTDNGKFQMVAYKNNWDTVSDVDFTTVNISKEVVLTAEGKIKNGNTEIGTWLMYGKGYIKFNFSDPTLVNGETVFYGVVRPAWLGNQNKSGFTITCMSHTPGKTRSMAMFMNAQSTLTNDMGDDLVG